MTEEETILKSIEQSNEHLRKTKDRIWSEDLTQLMQLTEEWSVESIHLSALIKKTWALLEHDLSPCIVLGQEPFRKEQSEAMAQSIGETLEDLVTVYDVLADKGRQLSTLMTQRLEELKKS
jgi:hypothetical protein